MPSTIEQDFSSQIAPQFDRFRKARVSNKSIDLMPPARYVPTRIVAQYRHDSDQLAFTIEMAETRRASVIRSQDNIDIDDRGFLREIRIDDFLSLSSQETKSLIGRVKEQLKLHELPPLQYDVNRRTLEILQQAAKHIRDDLLTRKRT